MASILSTPLIIIEQKAFVHRAKIIVVYLVTLIFLLRSVETVLVVVENHVVFMFLFL